jgi:hypothetical protein
MAEKANPWVALALPDRHTAPGMIDVVAQPPGPVSPQPAVPVPPAEHRLGRQSQHVTASLWWLGVHGGAGESTLTSLLPGSLPAGHLWPQSSLEHPSRVVLVCRSHWGGLTAAQWAATEWASGSLPGVELEGLVVMPDAPGRLPRPLRDLADLVAGGVPRMWLLPWVPQWRLSAAPDSAALPKSVHALIRDLNASALSLAR